MEIFAFISICHRHIFFLLYSSEYVVFVLSFNRIVLTKMLSTEAEANTESYTKR